MEDLRFTAAVAGTFILLMVYVFYVYTTGIGSKEFQDARNKRRAEERAAAIAEGKDFR
jgi:hypothetical protein